MFTIDSKQFYFKQQPKVTCCSDNARQITKNSICYLFRVGLKRFEQQGKKYCETACSFTSMLKAVEIGGELFSIFKVLIMLCQIRFAQILKF